MSENKWNLKSVRRRKYFFQSKQKIQNTAEMNNNVEIFDFTSSSERNNLQCREFEIYHQIDPYTLI